VVLRYKVLKYQGLFSQPLVKKRFTEMHYFQEGNKVSNTDFIAMENNND